MAEPTDRFPELLERLRAFRDERGWAALHTPKDLAAAIAIEASELQELFLWRPATSGVELSSAEREAVADELADVLIYCVYMADASGLDLLDAMDRKIRINGTRF